MSFSLDTPTATTLKAEAKALREQQAKAGAPMSQGAALESVAHAHGYRDWNTARARLPERVGAPVQVGNRVEGVYLGQPFKGMVIGVQMLTDHAHFTVTVKFDEPVDVVTSTLFSAFRHRVTATIDMRGVSSAMTGNGKPHMRLKRI